MTRVDGRGPGTPAQRLAGGHVRDSTAPMPSVAAGADARRPRGRSRSCRGRPPRRPRTEPPSATPGAQRGEVLDHVVVGERDVRHDHDVAADRRRRRSSTTSASRMLPAPHRAARRAPTRGRVHEGRVAVGSRRRAVRVAARRRRRVARCRRTPAPRRRRARRPRRADPSDGRVADRASPQVLGSSSRSRRPVVTPPIRARPRAPRGRARSRRRAAARVTTGSARARSTSIDALLLGVGHLVEQRQDQRACR